MRGDENEEHMPHFRWFVFGLQTRERKGDDMGLFERIMNRLGWYRHEERYIVYHVREDGRASLMANPHIEIYGNYPYVVFRQDEMTTVTNEMTREGKKYHVETIQITPQEKGM